MSLLASFAFLVFLFSSVWGAVISNARGGVGYDQERGVKVRPLVIWHGLGDSYNSDGMTRFATEVEEMHPGIFVHSIHIEEDKRADQRAGFYGVINDQIALVAEQISSIPELTNGFDAIGFSQGGQFLRAYVEMYNSPAVHNLITFGSQHMGISDIAECRPTDLLCQLARRAALGGVYSEWAQSNIIQAQYFRDPAQLSLYLEKNHFLPHVNNEIEQRNETYAQNLLSLNKLVLVLFAKDKTVVPKESSWFGSEAPPKENVAVDASASSSLHDLSPTFNADQKPFAAMATSARSAEQGDKTIIPMRLQPLYTEDWIGLKTLDERGDIVLETCAGVHMQLTGCWEDIVSEYVGGLLDD